MEEAKELIETEQLNIYVSIHFDCEGYICKIDGNVGCFHLSQQDKKYIAFIVHECGKIQYTELYQTIGEAYAQLIEYLRSYY